MYRIYLLFSTMIRGKITFPRSNAHTTMRTCFLHAEEAMAAMAAVPSMLRAEKTQCCVNIDDVLATYRNDLPIARPTKFPREFQVWKQKWRNIPTSDSELPNTPSIALTHVDAQMFPNVICLLRIMFTLSVTSYESERSVSVLCHLKT